MKIRNKFEGISIILAAGHVDSFFTKQRWEGTTEADKVLLSDERVNIDDIELKFGAFEYEVEMSIDETIQQIKNAKDICALIREEIKNFTDYAFEMKKDIEAKIEEDAAATQAKYAKAEEAVVVPPVKSAVEPVIVSEKDLATKIKDGIAAALESMKS
jgi:hypothetical protein